MADSKLDQGRACLILTGEAVMAEDIATALSDQFGDVEVIIARSPAEALAALQPVDRLLAAVADMDPEDFARHPLAAAVEARNGPVILISEEESALGPEQPWPVVEKPFRSEYLVYLLSS